MKLYDIKSIKMQVNKRLLTIYMKLFYVIIEKSLIYNISMESSARDDKIAKVRTQFNTQEVLKYRVQNYPHVYEACDVQV